jgi:hypothetical protein
MRKTVSLDDLDKFEEDETGQLYWKGNKLIVETRLQVPTVVNYFVIAAGVAALASAAESWISYFWPPLQHIAWSSPHSFAVLC